MGVYKCVRDCGFLEVGAWRGAHGTYPAHAWFISIAFLLPTISRIGSRFSSEGWIESTNGDDAIANAAKCVRVQLYRSGLAHPDVVVLQPSLPTCQAVAQKACNPCDSFRRKGWHTMTQQRPIESKVVLMWCNAPHSEASACLLKDWNLGRYLQHIRVRPASWTGQGFVPAGREPDCGL